MNAAVTLPSLRTNKKAGECHRISDGDATNAVEKMSEGQKFKVTVFFVIIDKLKTALRTRIEAYSMVFQRFSVLTEHDG